MKEGGKVTLRCPQGWGIASHMWDQAWSVGKNHSLLSASEFLKLLYKENKTALSQHFIINLNALLIACHHYKWYLLFRELWFFLRPWK